VEKIRRATKYGPARVAAELKREHGIALAPATVHRILVPRGINRVKNLDPPTGERMCAVLRFEHDAPGSMIHVDVKKLGRIPTGGGWWTHGRGTDGHHESKRRGQGTGAVGYTYLHSALDDHSRLAYTEPLENEKGTTAADFWLRAAAFFAEHGITAIQRAHRQWLLLPLQGMGSGTRRHRHQPSSDAAVHAAHERQGGAIQRDVGPRMGLHP
jgi:Integrase core domain